MFYFVVHAINNFYLVFLNTLKAERFKQLLSVKKSKPKQFYQWRKKTQRSNDIEQLLDRDQPNVTCR